MMAQQTASFSNSMTAYRVSTSDKNRESAWIRVHLSPDFYCKINPSLCLLASVLKRVILLMSKKESSGVVVRDILMLEKAS